MHLRSYDAVYLYLVFIYQQKSKSSSKPGTQDHKTMMQFLSSNLTTKNKSREKRFCSQAYLDVSVVLFSVHRSIVSSIRSCRAMLQGMPQQDLRCTAAMALGNSLHLRKQFKMSQNASPEIRIIRDIDNMQEKMQAKSMHEVH